MRANKKTALAFAVALGVVVPSIGYAKEGECYIDDSMNAMLKAVNASEDKMIEDVAKKTTEVIRDVDVKKGSCLPALDAFDALLRMRIPSIGGVMGGFFKMIKDMACAAANDFLEKEINGIDITVGDPYGVIKVGVGGTTGGNGGVDVDDYDLGGIVTDAAVDAIGGAIKDKVSGSGIGGITSGISGPQDRIPKVEDTINDGVRDAIKGL